MATVISLSAESMGAVFDLPNETLGLMRDKQPQKVCGSNKDCVHVIVPRTNAEQALKREQYDDLYEAMAVDGNIYFPADGSQPTTEEAGQYSCANVNDVNVTDWYIRAFGGDYAVEWSKNNDPNLGTADLAPELGFKKLDTPTEETTTGSKILTTLKAQTTAKHIITVECDDEAFKKAFWKNFRVIASDPVGKVLLYRLLLEIRRKYNSEQSYTYRTSKKQEKIIIKTGSTEDCNIKNNTLSTLGRRNNCRSIIIKSGGSCSFCTGGELKFSDSNDKETSVLELIETPEHVIQTKRMKRSADIGLFHEMLHWLHYLRDPQRFVQDGEYGKSYKYLISCYYGSKFNELFAWTTDIKLDAEEIRTILGTPNYNNDEELKLFSADAILPGDIGKCIKLKNGKFVGPGSLYKCGDDLSENAYRMSRFINDVTNRGKIRMRFGHTSGTLDPIGVSDRNPDSFKVNAMPFSQCRFMLANMVSRHCYIAVISAICDVWKLKKGEAAE